MQRPFVLQTNALSRTPLPRRTVGLHHRHTQHAPSPAAGDRCGSWYRNAPRTAAATLQDNRSQEACDGPEARIAPGGAEQGAKEPGATLTAGRRRRRRDHTAEEVVSRSPVSVKQTGSLAARGSNPAEAAQPPVQQAVGAAATPAPSTPAAVPERTVGNASQAEAVVGPANISRRGRRRASNHTLQRLSTTALRVPAAPNTANAASSTPQTAASTPAPANTDLPASEASRSNPVFRAIHLMQLRRQQLQNPAAAAGAINDAADAALLRASCATTQQQGGLQQEQEQMQVDAGAATAASLPTNLQRSRAALPADEVLVTENSHMNPVYRRIRLQELRQKLQRRLQGPQLPQHLQQVQQHQQQLPPAEAGADVEPVARGSQAFTHQRQRPRAALPAEEVLVTEASHMNPVYRRIRLQELRLRLQQQTLPGQHQSDSSRSTLAANSCRSPDARTQSRGPTQGLNSVQRAIRMAELQRSLQQRQETRTPAGSRNTRSRAGAAAGSAAGASPTPWFLEDTTTGLYSGSQGHGSRNIRPQQRPSAATAATTSDAQIVMQQLVAAGVSTAAASEIAGLGALADSAAGFGSQSSPVLGRILQLQELLGLPSVAAAAKIVIKQPNLVKRDPQTLRRNLSNMCKALQLPQAKVQKVFAAYPPALDMSPASVASKVATLAATLDVPASRAVKVACGCPRILGLSSETLTCKVSGLQSALGLPCKIAAVEVILGFPSVLGLSTDTLAEKYQQLKTLAQQRRDWQQQLLHLQQHKPGSLGRVLAAGPRVVERLQYLLDAGEPDQLLENSGGSGSGTGDFDNNSTISCQQRAADEVHRQRKVAGPRPEKVDHCGTAAKAHGWLMSKSSVQKGGLVGGNLAALLIMSEGTFMKLHPEFGLWRLEQRSTA